MSEGNPWRVAPPSDEDDAPEVVAGATGSVASPITERNQVGLRLQLRKAALKVGVSKRGNAVVVVNISFLDVSVMEACITLLLPEPPPELPTSSCKLGLTIDGVEYDVAWLGLVGEFKDLSYRLPWFTATFVRVR